MSEKKIGVDYSILHQIDSPANRLLRKSIWGEDDDIGQQSFITPVYLDELIRRLKINERSYVLDVGSGVGGPAIYIASKTGGRIAGIDISQVGVDMSRKLAKRSGLEEKTEFHLGNAMKIPFGDDTFDIAISLNVMNVFEDKTGLFKEVCRVLKRGGVWAFLSGTFDMPDDPEVKRKMVRGYLIPQYYDSLSNYRDKLKNAGFEIEEITEYVSDFRVQNKKWGDAYKKHYDEIVKEQGKENTDYHILYFDTYLQLIDEGRAANHLIISRNPE
ncbi:MAG: class I SAM-dependent methyltransferase [Thermodesulfobacteriota bacterium]